MAVDDDDGGWWRWVALQGGGAVDTCVCIVHPRES